MFMELRLKNRNLYNKLLLMYSLRSEEKCRAKKDSGWFWTWAMLVNNYRREKRKMYFDKIKPFRKGKKNYTKSLLERDSKKLSEIRNMPKKEFNLQQYLDQPEPNFHYD